MSSIRPLERNDLPAVVELYERAMRSGRPDPPPGLAPYFERTLVDYPGADPEIPSLVYEGSDGRILGFIGSHVRRLRFDGEPIRMGCSGQLVSDPAQRRLAVGAKLLRSYMSGPQDLTITDGGTDVVHQMWERLGGHILQPSSMVWIRLLRPFRAVGDLWLQRGNGRERWRAPSTPVLSALDKATTKLTRPPLPDAAVETEELSARALLEHESEAFGEARLRADYDEPFVEWLFDEMAAVRSRGRLVRRLVRRDGALLGWYVTHMKPGGLSRVVEVAATKGAMDSVLDRLFTDAWQSGVAALEGRLEPALFEPFLRRRCFVIHGPRALFHSRDPELVAAISLGASGLTRLDGESWMGHHSEPFR